MKNTRHQNSTYDVQLYLVRNLSRLFFLVSADNGYHCLCTTLTRAGLCHDTNILYSSNGLSHRSFLMSLFF